MLYFFKKRKPTCSCSPHFTPTCSAKSTESIQPCSISISYLNSHPPDLINFHHLFVLSFTTFANSQVINIKLRVMDVRRMNMKMSSHESSSTNNNNYGGKRMSMISKSKSKNRSSYFSVESMVVLVGLTVSLLILPLILPPLPPPPFMLLLLPICIFSVLVLFAFMPSSSTSSVRHKVMV